MLDFTSSLYLGLQHSSWSLKPWETLSLGKPAALDEPLITHKLASRLAKLIGCERATLATSTLHLFWDLFGITNNNKVSIYLDRGAYPIAQWGVERAAMRGVPVHIFQHHDPNALEIHLQKDALKKRLPIVIANGFCPGCGSPAPIKEYLECIENFGGRLILDDTQAIGVLGQHPCSKSPYGKGGGGILNYLAVDNPNVMVICSLAKSFGVPIAVLAGNSKDIKGFEAKSKIRLHCSPPAIGLLHAAEQALDINESNGHNLRQRLALLVYHFLKKLRKSNLPITKGFFPVKTMSLSSANKADILWIHNNLLNLGIKTVLHTNHKEQQESISFLITAQHCIEDLDYLVEKLLLTTKRLNGKIKDKFYDN